MQSSVVKKGTCDVPPVTTALESRRLENPVITFRLPVVAFDDEGPIHLLVEFSMERPHR